MGKSAALLACAIAAALPATGDAQTVGTAPPGPVAHKAPDGRGDQPDGKVKPGSGDPAARGRLLGSGYQRGWIEAGAELRLEQQFLAGHPASVAVVAAPDAVLALTVAEPGTPPFCRAAARGCRWRPLYTQRYAIVLRNAGTVRVRYYLVLE